MRTGMRAWVAAGALAVAVAGCGNGGGPEGVDTEPAGEQPRYKVSEEWCAAIDYGPLAEAVNGEVMTFPNERFGHLVSKIQLECSRSVFYIPPNDGMINARVVAYTYESADLAEERFWKSPSPQAEPPRLSAEVDRVTWGGSADVRTIRMLDSNLTMEVGIGSTPGTPTVPVEHLEDFTDHVIEVIRANPGV